MSRLPLWCLWWAPPGNDLSHVSSSQSDRLEGAEVNSEIDEFSPRYAMQKTSAVAMRNVTAAREGEWRTGSSKHAL